MSLVCLSLMACRSSSGLSSANTPQQMFQYVVLTPIPARVTNLCGMGDILQGYSLYRRVGAPAHIVYFLSRSSRASRSNANIMPANKPNIPANTIARPQLGLVSCPSIA